MLAPKAPVAEPNAGGGAEAAGVPKPKDVCGAPNVNAKIVKKKVKMRPRNVSKGELKCF